MSKGDNPKFELLSTGIPGLDEVLGGGLPEYSFNLIAGIPGAGKTTFAHQLLFANATEARPALYFTIIGEPALKMLRYQQQMEFFDLDKLGSAIRFVDMSAEVSTGGLELVLEKMIAEVVASNPAFVVVDSFRTLVYARGGTAQMELQSFVQQLALQLTSWQVTSFLIGEYGPSELVNNPVMTIADSILVLSQSRDRNSIVRKLEVMKTRGMASIPGLHTFRISKSGLQVFPRTTTPSHRLAAMPSNERAAMGIPELDEMLGGGFPLGDATLVVGPSGTGKTMMSTQFIAEGVRNGEGGVLAVFEEHPDDYLSRAHNIGVDLEAMTRSNKLRVIHLRPLDLSADEILYQIHRAIDEIGARRLVIDSLNGLELALAPTFRDDFRESIYRMVGGLTGGGVSVLFTVEVAEAFDQIRFSPHEISFLAQNIIFLRYFETRGELRKMLTVVKMRRSAHSRELREYVTGANGLEIKSALRDYSGVLTGTPILRAHGLIEEEQRILSGLLANGPATAAQIDGGNVERSLKRLLDLGYVVERDGTYQAVVR